MNNSKTIANGILRAAGIMLGVFLLLFLLYKIQSVIAYVAIAAVISLIGRPIVRFLRRKLKFNNTIAVVVTMLLLVGLLVGLIGMFIPLIAEQGHNLSLLNINKLQTNIEDLYIELTQYFNLNHVDVEQSLKDSKLLSKLDLALIPDFLNSVLSSFGSFSIGLLSVLFISFFFLKDSSLFFNGIMAFIPRNKEQATKQVSSKISNLLSRYFIGLILQILIIFVIYTIGLLIVGVDNAIIIAFLCALLNLIPYVGPFIGAILMLTLTLTSNLGENFNDAVVNEVVGVAIVFIIGQLIDNFLSQPIIFSKSVKSHPLEIFLVIIIAGILFGVMGMIIAIPTYTAIKVILKEFLSEYKVVQKLTKDL